MIHLYRYLYEDQIKLSTIIDLCGSDIAFGKCKPTLTTGLTSKLFLPPGLQAEEAGSEEHLLHRRDGFVGIRLPPPRRLHRRGSATREQVQVLTISSKFKFLPYQVSSSSYHSR